MWGFVGFIVAAIVVGFFAQTFYKTYAQVESRVRKSFTTSFVLLAIAMALWGVAALSGQATVVGNMVLAGDILLVIATGYLFHAVFDLSEPWLAGLLVVPGALLIVLRANMYPTEAYVDGGLLYFNLTGAPRIVLLTVLIAIWLPITLHVMSRAVRSIGRDDLRIIVQASCVSCIMATTIFVAAFQHKVVVASFIFVILAFMGLAASNVLATIPLGPTKKKTGAKKHGK